MTAFAVGGAIADGGMPAIRNANIVECGLRPGYFRSGLRADPPRLRQAEAWDTHLTAA